MCLAVSACPSLTGGLRKMTVSGVCGGPTPGYQDTRAANVVNRHYLLHHSLSPIITIDYNVITPIISMDLKGGPHTW